MTVASGATLEIDGVTLAPSSGRAVVSGRLVLRNGGQLKTFLSSEEDGRLSGYANSGEWTKEGAGMLVIEDPSAMPSNVHVKSAHGVFETRDWKEFRFLGLPGAAEGRIACDVRGRACRHAPPLESVGTASFVIETS